MVFGWQEAARNLDDEHDVRDDDGQESSGRRTGVVEQPADHAAVPASDEAEAAAEARDEAGQPAGGRTGRMRFEQQSAQGRGQGQGHEAGEDHGQRDGDRELAIEHAGDTAEEGDRKEDADEHADDRDDRAGDLPHGFLGGLERAQPLLAHEPLSVLKHDDGVVDHDADGDDHREERQDVDAVAQDPQPGARADERDGYRDHRDDRGTPRAEEKEDDDRHQEGGLDERAPHLADGGTHEAGGIERNTVLDVRRKLLGQVVHPHTDTVGGLERIGPGLQVDTDTGHGLTIQHAELLVALGTEFYAGDVTQAEHAIGGPRSQHDIAELLGGRQTPTGHDGYHEGGIHRRFLAEAADRVLGVRGTNRADDLGRSDAERGHAVRSQPDAHRVVAGTKDPGVADARDALEFLDDDRRREVAQEDGIPRGLGRDDGDRHEDVVRTLLGDHAEAADLLRQARLGELHAVGHEDGRHVWVDAVIEGDGDAERAAR